MINEEKSYQIAKLLGGINNVVEQIIMLEDLSFKQSLMILAIAPLKNITTSSVAKASNTSKQNSQKMINILIRQDYLIKKEVNNHYQYFLSKKAFSGYRLIQNKLKEQIDIRLKDFNEEQRDLFILMLQSLNISGD